MIYIMRICSLDPLLIFINLIRFYNEMKANRLNSIDQKNQPIEGLYN